MTRRIGDAILANLAAWHARGVLSRFLRTVRSPREAQQRTLDRCLKQLRGSRFERDHRLRGVRTLQDLRRACPLTDYEDLAPYVNAVAEGEIAALFHPRVRVHMFAVTSGTSAAPKLIPVTDEFIRGYRRGWNTFGMKMLLDHPDAVLRHIVQISSRWDERRTPAGIPCGAITGLLARMQKPIVRKYYVGRPEFAHLEPTDKYYAILRAALVRDVAFAVTANPATFLRLAELLDEHADRLIEDVQTGAFSLPSGTPPGSAMLRGRLPDPRRSSELKRLRADRGRLVPRDCWNWSFLACWTGGSMGHRLARVRELYGPVPIRDIGLLASEGRVTIPLDDECPWGVLDVTAGCFEFIPITRFDESQPDTLRCDELVEGAEYAVVLTNASGLTRYRLNDVVRVRGWLGTTPLLEFLHRGGAVSSLAGEKLTEHQVAHAMRATLAATGSSPFEYALRPILSDCPHYQLISPRVLDERWIAAFDKEICAANAEYADKRKTLRLKMLSYHHASAERFAAFHDTLRTTRGSAVDQFKQPLLLLRTPSHLDDFF